MSSILTSDLRASWPEATRLQASRTDWSFDLGSFAIGVLVAFLLVGLAYRYRHRMAQLWNRLTERANQLKKRLTANMATRYSTSAVETAQTMHIFAALTALEEVYVENRLWALLAQPQDAFESLSFSAAQALETSDRLLIIGTPGGGRTTLLGHILLVQARRVHAAGENERVPVYVYLPVLANELEAATEVDASDETVPAAGQQLMQTALSSMSRLVATGVARWLRQQIETGNTLILLDGWDEVQVANRMSVTAWIQELLDAYPGNRLLVTAGERGYGPLLDVGLVPLEIAPWSYRQLTDLAQRWSAVWPPNDGKRGKVSPSISYLLTPLTPLEATIEIVIQLRGQRPAGTPAGKMAQMMNLLLPQPETDEKGSVAWPIETGHRALGRLAFAALERGRMTLERAEIQSSVNETMPPMQFVSTDENEDELTREDTKAARDEEDRRTLQIVDCCRALTATGAPIRSWDNQRYFFTHPLVAAFLASRHLASEDKPAVAYADDPAWFDVLRFFAGLVPAEPLVKRLLTTPDDLFLSNLWTAVALLAASPPGNDAWRTELIKRLAQLFLNPRLPALLRDRCLIGLIESGEAGVVLLFRRHAENPDATLRAGAILGLSVLGDEQDLPIIDAALSDTDPQVRLATIHGLTALARQGSNAATELIIAAMIEAEDKVQRVAVEALADLGAEGHAVLRDGAHDQDLIVRRAAAYGLAVIGEPWAKETLERMQREDREWLVRNAATEALTALEMRENAEVPDIDLTLPVVESEPWLISWAAEQGEGTGVGDAALKTLLRALVEGDLPTRHQAIDTLRRLGDPRTVDLLRQNLRDREPTIRDATLTALDEISHRHNMTIKPT